MDRHTDTQARTHEHTHYLARTSSTAIRARIQTQASVESPSFFAVLSVLPPLAVSSRLLPECHALRSRRHSSRHGARAAFQHAHARMYTLVCVCVCVACARASACAASHSISTEASESSCCLMLLMRNCVAWRRAAIVTHSWKYAAAWRNGHRSSNLAVAWSPQRCTCKRSLARLSLGM